MTAIDDACGGALAALIGAAAVRVAYRAAGLELSLMAVPGRSQYEVDRGSGIERFETADWIFAAADLADHEPLPGDQIARVDGGAVRVYEVLSPAGAAPWQWHAARAGLRVHTKLVESG